MNPVLSPDVFNLIVEFIVLVFSLTIHEFAHAWTASRFGDLTARMLGRVTINPTKHIDPLGTILVPLIALVAGHGGMIFGWAKPTPVTTRNLRNLKWSYPLIILAGPISNFLLALIATISLCLMNHMASGGHMAAVSPASAASVVTPVATIFYSLLFINLILGFFNLIPLPPLDGSLLVRHWLPSGVSSFYDRIGVFGFFLTLLAGYFILPIFVGPAMAICIGIIRISG
jgi:Zn-dependent protease